MAEQTIQNRLNEARFFGRTARNKPHINQKNQKNWRDASRYLTERQLKILMML